jgi:hypothetical protein
MWHFTKLDCKLRYDDGRKVVAGETLTVDCAPILCAQGLHASNLIIDALSNAPGLYVWSVELGGERIDGDDKSAAQSRTALWGYDATDVILAWLRRVALDKIALDWDTSKFGAMPAVVMEFLRTGDKNIAAEAAEAAKAVEAAVYAAAEAASYAAIYAAANAARAAVNAAANAATNAARAAAWAAIYAANAARAAANAAVAAADAADAAKAAFAAAVAANAAEAKYNQWLEDAILTGRPTV